jgi:hypothetical protein
MNVLSPLGVTPDTVKPLARRPASLTGLRLGVLDNSKPNADVLLRRVAEQLATRAEGVTLQSWTKPRSSRPAAMIEEIASSVDVLLTASAD